MNAINEARFDLFDNARRAEMFTSDGMSTIGTPGRTVIDDFGFIEPYDDRDDTAVSIPMRSTVNAACGPAFELGPFDLDPADTVRLYNALADHMGGFKNDFTIQIRAAVLRRAADLIDSDHGPEQAAAALLRAHADTLTTAKDQL